MGVQRKRSFVEGVVIEKKRAVFIILMKRDMQGFIIDRTKSPEFSGKIDFVLFPVQKGKVFKNIDNRMLAERAFSFYCNQHGL